MKHKRICQLIGQTDAENKRGKGQRDDSQAGRNVEGTGLQAN